MSRTSYFDNAATTFPKPEIVYSEADRAFRTLGGSVGRGDGEQAKTATALARDSKTILKRLLQCEGKEVVYTASATDALNRILLGLSLEGATVYVSPFEHNAVTRVLHHLASTMAINVRQLPFDRRSLRLKQQETLDEFARNKPDLVVLTHASNVCGAVLPVEAICEIAKSFGAMTLVDMSQTAGLVPLRLSLDTIDFAVFAGHKTLLAPFGIGGFVCLPGERRIKPVLYGGNGIDSVNQDMPSNIVQMEEIGSQNVYAIAGLKASAQWLLDHVDSKAIEEDRSHRLLEILRSYPKISIVADEMACERIGVVSCLFEGYAPDEIGSVLSDLGVSVRTGLHCAPYAHEFLGTLPLGTVRFSVSALTTDGALEHLREALDYIDRNS